MIKFGKNRIPGPKDLEWQNFQNVVNRIIWNFACKSVLRFWCTVDQKISKTFKYFQVGIKSKLQGLKVILKNVSKKYLLESVETLFVSQKYHSDVLLISKFQKRSSVFKFESKVSCKGLKVIQIT